MKDSDWQYLLQLYQTPNITKTADALFISQAALSKRLQQLEQEWHIQIVARSKTGIEFTREGTYLARQAKRYLDFLHETRSRLEMIRNQQQTSISIYSSLSFLKYSLPDILSRYSAEYPYVRFDISGGRSSEMLEAVRSGKADFAIICMTPPPNMWYTHIGTDQAYIVSSQKVEPDEIEKLPMVDFIMNPESRQNVEDWWSQKFHSAPLVRMRMQYMDQTWPMIERGLGHTICFLPLRARIPALDHLYTAPLFYNDGTPLVRQTYLVHPDRNPLTKEQEEFVDFIRREFDDSLS